MDHKTWMIIINPSAGGGRTALLWPRISNFFIKAGLQFECVFTTHKFHAVSLTVEAIHDGARNIIVIGGDGTIHEVVNGIFFQKDVPTREITLGLIPIGTGNDLIHTYDIPADYMEAAKTLLKGRSVITDVGKVTFQDYGVERTRFFANVAGFGLDAAVIRHYERSIEEKRRRGEGRYLRSLLRQFLLYRAKNLRVLVDDRPIYDGPVLTGDVGIGKYIGSGMIALPLAVADDGLFDVTLVGNMSKLAIGLRIKDFVKGNVYAFKESIHARGSKVEVYPNSTNGGYLETDGEPMGTPPFVFTILPGSLNLIVGESFVASTGTATSAES
ncbi:MAG: diacylglycerol kinase family protein [Bacteroidales bacterium]|jgi:YegS/Rv2252/BmrU family lipid kinase|nr:diacylglycerol kinase family lipid kinase [Bacteroidales bacterium]MDD4256742.1 diacylglycerol kinase family lipid kinase [Bacteroidales bacterium]MDD4655308.1 diacylglycerol kinase family lipid kinase [Bacteroidales bacterium]MDD4828657.1 diacylglycerol kinase family lipid kinase [Bacteroidales bacterium]